MPFALVTGGSRGVGRGAVLGLAEGGFTVFATGRSVESADLPESVVRIPCDHTRDEDTARAFQKVGDLAGELDVLVNAAWGGYERMSENDEFTWGLPFWKQPMHRWAAMMDSGARAAFVASAGAATWMVARRRGLIVNISSWAARKYIGNVIYGAAHAAIDKMSASMAHELRAHNVAAVSLYPGMVRTESVMAAANAGWLDVSKSESPEFIGRVVAALHKDPLLMRRSGEALVAAVVARELGVVDVDGSQPVVWTLETV